MLQQELNERARALLDLCRGKRLKLAAAESCTGGLLAATLTEIPGSSDVFERGFITYSNEAKETMLGVASATLQSHGAVSSKPPLPWREGCWRTRRSILRYRSPASPDREVRCPVS